MSRAKSSKKTAAAAKPSVAKTVPATVKPKAPARAKAVKKPATKAAPAQKAKKPGAGKTEAKAPPAAAETKIKKSKTIRDSFNMPEFDYALIGVLKKRALAGATEVKKSELLRAGLKALAAMTDKDFAAALKAVHVVKTGRPGKRK